MPNQTLDNGGKSKLYLFPKNLDSSTITKIRPYILYPIAPILVFKKI